MVENVFMSDSYYKGTAVSLKLKPLEELGNNPHLYLFIFQIS